MRKWACRTALWLVASIAAPVEAAAPYPQSTLITGVTWVVASYQWSAQDGDIWPITWAGDGTLVTAWGDGWLTCPAKASYGVAAVASAAPSTVLAVRHCGPGPSNKGKMMAMIGVGSQVYTRMNPQDGSSYSVWRSNDYGRTWTKPSTTMSFVIDSFVQFGAANDGAPGAYVYALESRLPGINLLRVSADKVQSESAYEYFSGTPANPAWSSQRSAARSIFNDNNGIARPTITYVPGLKRYILAVGHTLSPSTSGGNTQGMFESATFYGPWSTIYYSDNHLQMRAGHYLGTNFPIKWQAADGKTLWSTFSCHNKGDTGACGVYHDRFNLMRVSLQVSGTVAAPTAKADTAQTAFGTPVTIRVLDNDTGSQLTLASVSDPPRGTTRKNTDQTVTYTPDASFSGTDSFSYTIKDGLGRTATATVTVTVLAKPAPDYLGCYKDQGVIGSTSGRTLNGFLLVDKVGMSTNLCLSTCKQYAYAGTESGTQCFCGNTRPTITASNCNVPCVGATSETCGGTWALSVYQVP